MDLTNLTPPDAWQRLRAQQARHASARGRRDWYRVTAKASDEAEILIYDAIGSWDGVSAKDFVRDLAALDAARITVRINSPGGDVFDGVAIFNALASHKAHITTQVDGLAASAASFIAMAGDEIVMAKHATMMIHDAHALAIGNAQDMREVADLLDRVSDTIAAMYADRAGKTAAHWRDLMRAETWYSDQEAVDAKLADRVAGDKPATKNSFDLSLFRHPPEGLASGGAPPKPSEEGGEAPTKRDAERALRDAGLSHSQAKALVARGWGALDEEPRDVAGLLALRDAVNALRN